MSESHSNSSSSSSSSSGSDSEKEDEPKGPNVTDEGTVMKESLPRTANEKLPETVPVQPLPEAVGTLEDMEVAGAVRSCVNGLVVVETASISSAGRTLDQGSILCVMDDAAGVVRPMGRIDEVFGPISSPFYTMRIASSGLEKIVKTGTTVLSPRTLNDAVDPSKLFSAGSDASNVFDEELAEEQDFSDDEKEAAARRSRRRVKVVKRRARPPRTSPPQRGPRGAPPQRGPRGAPPPILQQAHTFLPGMPQHPAGMSMMHQQALLQQQYMQQFQQMQMQNQMQMQAQQQFFQQPQQLQQFPHLQQLQQFQQQQLLLQQQQQQQQQI